MTITLPNNQPHLYQWDTRITLTVPATLTALHTILHGQPITLAVTDGTVTLPDELLQTPGYLCLWAYRDDHTQDAAAIWVQPRPKPTDYVYTPTEIQHFSDLEERISALEQGGGGVTSVNGKTGNVTVTAEDTGALTQSDLQLAIETALAQAKASGAFDGASIRWRGAYDQTAAYQRMDAVQYEGSSYIFVGEATIGAIPGIDEEWDLMAGG